MQQYLDALLNGKKENKLIILDSLGIPGETIELPDEAKDKPHLAIVDDVIYIWSVEAQEWITYVPDTTTVTLDVDSDTEYELPDDFSIWKIAIKTTDTSTIRIGITPGGNEIMEDKDYVADKWAGITYDIYPPVTLYFTGITDTTTIKIRRLTV